MGGLSLASSWLFSAAWGLESLLDLPYHPLAGIFISSETPKEREPMKSFRVVRSQSQISTDSRRSLSEGFNLLQNKHIHNTLSCLHHGKHQHAHSLCLKQTASLFSFLCQIVVLYTSKLQKLCLDQESINTDPRQLILCVHTHTHTHIYICGFEPFIMMYK